MTKDITNRNLGNKVVVPPKEEPYETPENWFWTRLENISQYIQRGKSPKYTEKSIVKVVSQKCVQWSGFDISQARFIEESTLNSYKDERFLKKNDLLWNSTGTGTVGRVAIIEDEITETVVADSHVTVVRLNNNIANSQFLYRWLSSHYVQNKLNGAWSGSTNQVELNLTTVKQQFVPLPPITEQERIANKVENLLSKINEAKGLIEEARETFEIRCAAILEKAFRGELTANWREKNNAPFNWEEKRFEELIKNGPQNGLYKPQSAYGKGTLIVRIDNFYNGIINDWNTLKRLQLEQKEKDLYGLNNNDILINRVNSIEYLGKSALVRRLEEPCVFESNVMRIGLNEMVIPEFIILYLNSLRGLHELRKNAKHAVNQASINQQDVKNVLVPLPNIEEQKEIVSLVNALLKKEKYARINVDIVDDIELLKQSILSKAFRGELGTNDPNEESALELLKEILSEAGR
jgi:type I restriction enzyme, S subunit